MAEKTKEEQLIEVATFLEEAVLAWEEGLVHCIELKELRMLIDNVKIMRRAFTRLRENL